MHISERVNNHSFNGIITTNEIKNGMYILKIITDNNNSVNHKVIISHN